MAYDLDQCQEKQHSKYLQVTGHFWKELSSGQTLTYNRPNRLFQLEIQKVACNLKYAVVSTGRPTSVTHPLTNLQSVHAYSCRTRHRLHLYRHRCRQLKPFSFRAQTSRQTHRKLTDATKSPVHARQIATDVGNSGVKYLRDRNLFVMVLFRLQPRLC